MAYQTLALIWTSTRWSYVDVAERVKPSVKRCLAAPDPQLEYLVETLEASK